MGRSKVNRNEIRFPYFWEQLLSLQGDMTQEQFAEKLGISRQTVGFYLAGQRIQDALGVVNIAEKMCVSADWLLGVKASDEMKTATINKKEAIREIANASRSLDALLKIVGGEAKP